MKRDTINYLLVGLFTIAMFAVVLVALFRITGRNVNTTTYYALFDRVPGVRSGTPVTYNGFRIGQVTAITPHREKGVTRYQLGLAVRSDWEIPDDSTAHIVAPGLLAERVIDIQEGRSEHMLAAGATIRGSAQSNVLATFANVAAEFQNLSRNSIRPLLDNLNTNLTEFTTQFGGKLDQVTDQLEQLLEKLNASAAQLNRVMSPINEQRMTTIVENADRISRNLAELTAGINETRHHLDALLRDSKQMVSENRPDMRQTVLSLRNVLSQVDQSMNAIMYNLESTSRNLSEFSREIRHNPSRLLGGRVQPDKASD